MCTCALIPGAQCGMCALADLMCDVIVTMEDLGPRYPRLRDHTWYLRAWEAELLGDEPSPIFDALIDSRLLVPSIALY